MDICNVDQVCVCNVLASFKNALIMKGHTNNLNFEALLNISTVPRLRVCNKMNVFEYTAEC